jgi:hypothetical protein
LADAYSFDGEKEMLGIDDYSDAGVTAVRANPDGCGHVAMNRRLRFRGWEQNVSLANAFQAKGFT